MFAQIRRLWAAAPWATALAGLAVLAAVVFAVRLTIFTIYWSDPGNRDQAIAPWMTPGYIAMSWHVPNEILRDVIPPPEEGEPKRASLKDIADRSDVPVDQLIAEIEQAIAAFRLDQKDGKP